MSEEIKMSDVLLRAVILVLTRSGDVLTEDGCFATCDTDEMICLDCELSEFFNLDSDNLELRHVPLIKAKAKDIDIKIESHDRLAEENKRLRELIEKIDHGGKWYINNAEMFSDIKQLLSELGGE